MNWIPEQRLKIEGALFICGRHGLKDNLMSKGVPSHTAEIAEHAVKITTEGIRRELLG